MALILSLETSTAVCSAALSDGTKLLELKESNSGYNHASLLTVFVEELMASSGVSLSDLDAIAVSKGPGSYTGLRIGVSVAKGYCFALDKKLLSVSALDCMALALMDKYKNLEGEKVFAPMIDARRMEVYTAFYNQSAEQIRDIEALIVDAQSLLPFLDQSKLIIAGDGAAKCKDLYQNENLIFDEDLLPSAKYMIKLAEEAFEKDRFEDVAYFEPYYLKDFIAGKPKVKGLF
jgi:tRNA threonylcarbamoyladenosine biosynthesis protein TsaB